MNYISAVVHAYFVYSYYAGCDSSNVHVIQHHGQSPSPLGGWDLPRVGRAFSV